MAAPLSLLVAALLVAAVHAQTWLGKQCSTTAGGASSLSELAPQLISHCACHATAYASVGSGAGISGFTSGIYCIGASDDAMTDTQDALAGSSKKLTIPIVISSYGFFVGGGTSIVAKMDWYSTYNAYFGTNTQWGTPVGYWPVKPVGVSGAITPIYRSDNSGTTFIVKKFWSAAGQKSVLPYDETPFSKSTNANLVASAVGVSGGQTMCATIGNKAGSLGYSQIGLCVNHGYSLTEIYLKNAAGYYLQASSSQAVAQQAIGSSQPARTSSWASYTTVFQAGQYTPAMVSFEYWFVRTTYSGVTGGPAAKSLALYANGQAGQSLATPYGFDPLPSQVIQGNVAALQNVVG